jgi:hypothetical protein
MGGSDVYIEVFLSGGVSMHDSSPRMAGPSDFSSGKNQSLKIRAVSATHEAEAVVRSSEPETKVTLKLRPQQQ